MELKKVVPIKDTRYYNQQAEDLKYWLSRSPEERISMVENLRKEMLYNGAPPRLQRTITIYSTRIKLNM